MMCFRSQIICAIINKKGFTYLIVSKKQKQTRNLGFLVSNLYKGNLTFVFIFVSYFNETFLIGLTSVGVSVTYNPRSSSWQRVYCLNWSWGCLGTHPEDKETDTVIFIIPLLNNKLHVIKFTWGIILRERKPKTEFQMEKDIIKCLFLSS